MSTSSNSGSNQSSYGDQEVKSTTDPITLTRFLLDERMQHPEGTGSFSLLLQSIQLAAKIISNAMRRAGIANLTGLVGHQNATGDEQKKLDVLSNDVLINCLAFSNQAYIIGSEESDNPIIMDTKEVGGYAIVFDPLDGSSNIDCNLSVGTIFGIFAKDHKSNKKPTVKDLYKPGTSLLAAGYAMYDAATILALTTGNGVNGFTLDTSIGEFILTHRDMKIPKKGKTYSCNEGNSLRYDEPTKEFLHHCKESGYSLRYAGSMVGDVHRTLLYGGIFMYPGDIKSPNGKLRLLYECNPMAMLVEQAGGKATTGTQRILDIVPTALHQRVPIFLGSPDDVTEVEELYKKHGVEPGGKKSAKL